MSKQTVQIRISADDEPRLQVCKDIYKKHHKDLIGINLSNEFIEKKIIDFYIDGE